jgi:hypothetical integral membrane protein (TIGR02206 family)
VAQFSPPHLAALAVLVALAIAVTTLARTASPGVVTIVYRALAVAILCGWVGEYVADVVQGIWTVRYDLPLQLTDVVSVTSAFALWTQHRRAAEFTYLWALSASLQATLTPDLAWDFPSVFYFTYFIYHVGAIVAGVALVFGSGLYPRPGAPLRVFAATVAWALVAGAGDVITGGNYMYLRAKPVHGSLLSDMGPWPVYLLGAAAIGLAMLYIAQGIADLAARHDRRTVVATARGAQS